ncbi:MAG: hypothetical protein RLZZ205_301 [Bacteroidota bacterium]|jgi:hypothetical protein
MKVLLQLLFILYSSAILSQNFEGLEGVYVEHYYQSNEKDNQGGNLSGELKTGSKTYRIYLDLAPGYRFQAAYGTSQHPLTFHANAPFFNHAGIGNTYPNVIPERSLSKNVTLLDSWFSVGAAAENLMGIPKKFDLDDNRIASKFEKNYLTNNTKWMDYALTERDGMRTVAKLPVANLFQLDSVAKNLMMITRSNHLEIDNGAWACLGKGSVGIDSLGTNYVLIAQLTTLGELEYNLNVMIGTPQGKSIKYVWGNPQQGEIICPLLQGTTKKEKKKRRTIKK